MKYIRLGDLLVKGRIITQEQLELVLSRYLGQSATGDIPGFTGSTAPATRAQVAAALLNLSLLTNSNQQETTNLMYPETTKNPQNSANAAAPARPRL